MKHPLTRSQLFVPGDRHALYEKAVASGADAIVIDLEDAFHPDSKEQARAFAVDYLGQRDMDRPTRVSVRVNDPRTRWHLDDIVAIVEAGVDCIALPKVGDTADVIGADRLIGAAELRSGRQYGVTLLHPLLETPRAIRSSYEIGTASPRVAFMGGLAIPGGDIEAGVGSRWTPEGLESLAYRSSVLLDARAASVPSPVTGVWADLDDLKGLRHYAEASRAIGYDGMMVIHPSHVAVVNEVFTPTAAELNRDRKLVEALRVAAGQNSASTRFDGQMIDLAMGRRAEARLAAADRRHAD
jgi:citrate lyase subunit beta/citryl-CoA lyase